MKKLLLLLLGLLLFLFLGYFCVYKYTAPDIEADIQQKVEKSLARNNLQSVKVKTNGRDITLQGEVGTDELKALATRAAGVKGHNLINNQIVVVAEPPEPVIVEPYTLLLRLKDDQSIVLSGNLPNAEAKSKLLSLAYNRYGRSHVTDDLSIRAEAPAQWSETAIAGLNSFSRLKQGQVRLSDQEFFLKGVTDSEKSRQLIGGFLEGNLPQRYTGHLDIAVVAEPDAADKKEEISPEQQAKNCQKEFKNLLTDNKILFETGGATIAKNSTKLLDKLVLIAMSCPNQTIIIAGHTDAKGSNKNNKKLSQKRAQAVANYLQEKGIGKNNLKAIGYGEEKPIATNRTSKGRALNRRIEFTVEGVK